MTHTQANVSSAESLSALVDGDFESPVLTSALDDKMRAVWNSYQAIGDVLRAPGAAASKAVYGADAVFVQRLMQRLENEKIENSPPRLTATFVAKPHAAAANDATFRWKLVAGFASFGAMAAVAWSLVSVPGGTPEQLAKNAAATELVVTSPQGPMVRDARLEELLSAHKQLGGTSLQAPSGFLRNAGFESTNNGQR